MKISHLAGTLLGTLLLCLSVTCASAAAQENVAQVDAAEEDIEQLIDDLVKVSEPDIGYAPLYSGSVFLPVDKTAAFSVFVLGGTHRAPSPTLRKLVEHGAAAVPALLRHLDDKRQTSLPAYKAFSAVDFANRYDFNIRTWRGPTPQGVNIDDSWMGDHPKQHTITVGDLCFVALGQIVNRDFAATEYQPSGILVVSSPSYSQELREVVRKEWGGLTPESHKQRLIDDYERPDTLLRRQDAYQRLGFYYPDAVADVVLATLGQPVYDAEVVYEFVWQLETLETTDERQAAYEEFIETHGPQYADGVQDVLFSELTDANRLDVELALKLPKFINELFGSADEMANADRPSAISTDERLDVIGSLIYDDNQELGDYVLRTYQGRNPEDHNLASACLNSLAHRRGYTDVLMAAVDELDLETVEHPEWNPIRAIAETKDELVRARLREVIRTTNNRAYFFSALPAAEGGEPDLVFDAARRLLSQLPAETNEAAALLNVVAKRYPDRVTEVYEEFLEPNTVSRIATICRELSHGDERAIGILAPYLDDRRAVQVADAKGKRENLRVCDLAAGAIADTTRLIPFEKWWSERGRDGQIRMLKDYCRDKLGQ